MIALIAALAVVASAPPPIQYWRGGDDGLSMRLFDRVIGGEANWKPCDGACFNVTVQQVRPQGDGAFRYRVLIGAKGARPTEPAVRTLEGTCRETAVEACGDKIRGEIAAAIAALGG